MFSRRSALMLFGLGGVASAGLFGYGLAAPLYLGQDVALQQALLQILPDRSKAAAIGKAWMKQYRIGFISPKILAGRLARQLQVRGWTDRGDVIALRQALAEAVRKDFLHGSVVDVRGWQIARTHADLCALAHLSAQRTVS